MDFLAIATVTSVLRRLLLERVRRDVPGIDVTTVSPAAAGHAATSAGGINVFLYRVSPSAPLRNRRLPEGSELGTRAPQMALDLHYLLSFYGDEAVLEPQRVLASALTALHAAPVLTGDRLAEALEADPPPFLSGADPAGQVESITFTIADLSLSELCTMWSGLFRTSYVLSMAPDASVIPVASTRAPDH